MADQKISALTALTGANVEDTADEIPIVDASAGQTKSITRRELFSHVDGSTFHVDGANNRVGVGTTSPSEAFQVAGTIRVGSGSTWDAKIFSGTPAVSVGGSTSAAIISNYGTGGSGWHVGIEVPANDSSDGFYIATDSDLDGVVDTLAVKVRADGNVGLGTTSPTEKLHVVGNILTSGDVSVGGTLDVTGGTTITGAASAASLALNGAVQWGTKVTIADDAVATITPPFKGGWMAISVDSGTSFPQGNMAILGHIDVGSSLDFKQVYKGSLTDILTNNQDLSVTPGTDGQMTVSLRSNGTVQVNNRTGISRTIDLHLNGATS